MRGPPLVFCAPALRGSLFADRSRTLPYLLPGRRVSAADEGAERVELLRLLERVARRFRVAVRLLAGGQVDPQGRRLRVLGKEPLPGPHRAREVLLGMEPDADPRPLPGSDGDDAREALVPRLLALRHVAHELGAEEIGVLGRQAQAKRQQVPRRPPRFAL